MKNKKKNRIIILNSLMALFSLIFPLFIMERGQEFMENHFSNTFELIYGLIIISCVIGFVVCGATAHNEIEFYNDED